MLKVIRKISTDTWKIYLKYNKISHNSQNEHSVVCVCCDTLILLPFQALWVCVVGWCGGVYGCRCVCWCLSFLLSPIKAAAAV